MDGGVCDDNKGFDGCRGCEDSKCSIGDGKSCEVGEHCKDGGISEHESFFSVHSMGALISGILTDSPFVSVQPDSTLSLQQAAFTISVHVLSALSVGRWFVEACLRRSIMSTSLPLGVGKIGL